MLRFSVQILTAESANRRGGTGSRGFTLVELLVVIAILAALMGLLLPAVMGPIGGIPVSQVTVEIRGLEAAISQFKSVFGKEPPSRIRLYETAAGWTSPHAGTFVEPVTGATVTHESERLRSVALINGLWGNFDFSNPVGWDFNYDGSVGGFVDLTGAECLVFFLGGVQQGGSGGPYAMTGFSRNPANPFATATGNESREGPFFEFKPSRLSPSQKPANAGMVVYHDPHTGQTAPYVYASSYDGRGYQLADLYVGSADDLNNVYRTGPSASAVPQKAKAFQIISPGRDGLYGSGGNFDSSGANHGLTSQADYDNITNFHSGMLNK